MGIKTEDFVKNLPPKTITAEVEWLRILDEFNPAVIAQRFLDECARRNPYETCYRWDTPYSPVDERLRHARFCEKQYRKNLVACVERIEREGLSELTYKNARLALITAIGIKGAAEYVRREYDRLGEKGRLKQIEEYKTWESEQLQRRMEEEYDYPCFECASVHEKVIRIRKGFLGTDGKPLTQRDFAKLIDYPINRYVEAERIDRYGRGDEESLVDDELLEKLIMIAHANPYWLYDSECYAEYAEYDFDNEAVLYGDAPTVYAKPDVILKWIKEDKPRFTRWEDYRIS